MLFAKNSIYGNTSDGVFAIFLNSDQPKNNNLDSDLLWLAV